MVRSEEGPDSVRIGNARADLPDMVPIRERDRCPGGAGRVNLTKFQVVESSYLVHLNNRESKGRVDGYSVA